MKSVAVGLAGMLALLAPSAHSQTIYPLNRAEILSGSKFDLKVEFPDAPDQGNVRVTINGEDAASALGKGATFVAREDGADHSAYWIRDAARPPAVWRGG